MDNLIAGVVGVVLFLAFVFGLAQSIGALPFVVIVAIVAALALIDLWQSVKPKPQQHDVTRRDP